MTYACLSHPSQMLGHSWRSCGSQGLHGLRWCCLAKYFFLVGLRGASGLWYARHYTSQVPFLLALVLEWLEGGYEGWQHSRVRDRSWWTRFWEFTNFSPSPVCKLSWVLVHGATLGQPSKSQFAEINSNWLVSYQHFGDCLICLHPSSL